MDAVRRAARRPDGFEGGRGGRLAATTEERPVWDVVEVHGTVAELHARPLATVPRRKLAFCEPLDAAVVLGSAQDPADIDEARCAEAGFAVVRRSSGGGAVLVEPGAQVWVDFDLPPHDPLFVGDVARSFGWLGELWAGAIAEALAASGLSGPAELAPHTVTSPARADPLGRTLCFAGLGAGEVLLDGKKVVGLSQRRRRDGVRFQTMAPVRDQSERLAHLVAGPTVEQRRAAAALRTRSAPLAMGEMNQREVGAALKAALLSRLPS